MSGQREPESTIRTVTPRSDARPCCNGKEVSGTDVKGFCLCVRRLEPRGFGLVVTDLKSQKAEVKAPSLKVHNGERTSLSRVFSELPCERVHFPSVRDKK